MFKVDDLVFAEAKTMRPWPSRILRIQADSAYVFLYGAYMKLFVDLKDIYPYNEKTKQEFRNYKSNVNSKLFEKALEEIEALDSELKRFEKESKVKEFSTEGLNHVVQGLEDSVQDQNERLEIAEDEIQKLKPMVTTMKDSLFDHFSELEYELNAKIEGFDQENRIENVENEMKKLNSEILELRNERSKAEITIERQTIRKCQKRNQSLEIGIT